MVNLTCFKLYHLYGNSTNGRSDLFALFLLYITNTKPQSVPEAKPRNTKWAKGYYPN